MDAASAWWRTGPHAPGPGRGPGHAAALGLVPGRGPGGQDPVAHVPAPGAGHDPGPGTQGHAQGPGQDPGPGHAQGLGHVPGPGLGQGHELQRTEGLVLVTGGPGQGIGVVALRNPAIAPVRIRIMVENSRTTVLPRHAVPNQGHAPLPTVMMLDLNPWMHTPDPPPGHPDPATVALAPPPPGKMGVATALMAPSWMMGRSKGVDTASGVASRLLSY